MLQNPEIETIKPEQQEDIISEQDLELKWVGYCKPNNKQLGVVTFIFLVAFCLMLGAEVVYIFNPNGNIAFINTAFISSSLARIIFFLTNLLVLVGWQKTLLYVFTLDPITLPLVIAVYAYNIFLYSIFDTSTIDIVGMVTLSLMYITYTAYHRAIVAEAIWRQWQVIIYKLGLIASTGVFVVWGIMYIFPGISWTNEKNDDLDNAVQQFMMLYVWASADLMIKLYEALCDLDKTSDLKVQLQKCNSIIIHNQQS